MRYEDLKLNPKPVLESLFCFLLNVSSIAGTLVEKRIADVTATDFTTKGTYKLKSNSKSLSRSNHMYTDAQMDLMKTELSDYISFWKYDATGQQNDESENAPNTNFFDSPTNSDNDNF